ncbi:hypothetical protein [Jatrophihabitans endophyticus]|uniref:hypothetical protein n=1 Tax=Jatrophihabitans endophyticus TaxID=1206085 RepID=UPI001A056C7E|nr:hypothetical protein [Jatrophihabitans endophyticus]MBE7186893.1 hypothetical protein [Jatrophihabitans endophyticus]
MGDNPSTAFVAIAAVLVLGLVLMWVCKPSRPRQGSRPVDASESPNLGLLTVVVSGLDRQDAMLRRAKLGEARIRSSMSTRRDGMLDVLVFHADADRARMLLDT